MITSEIKSIRTEIKDYASQKKRPPKIGIIRIGYDNFNEQIIKSKIDACKEAGIECHLVMLEDDAQESVLNHYIRLYADDKTIDRILVLISPSSALKATEMPNDEDYEINPDSFLKKVFDAYKRNIGE